ncbi:ADP-glyceromanno-heptose 6-epimerase [Alphaproteobacteria bacterium]|nr:ADP-glyceromanno-heptose 6-epimerase [Alphaproteobacteria bacterium]
MIIVTGGAGFIGSNLINALIKKKYDVILCDYLTQIKKNYFKEYNQIKKVIVPNKLFEFIKNNNVDIIYHLGAISATTHKNPNKQWLENVIYSTKLWEICSEKDIRLIYASSAATYGNGDLGFKDYEELNYVKKLRAMNVYGWTKNEIDIRNIYLKNKFGFRPSQWVALKFFNVYGLNEFHKKNMISIVLKTFLQIKNGKETCLFKSYKENYKDGEQERDFIYVKDCIDTLLWFLGNKNISGIYNIGTGASRTFNELINCVYKSLNKNINVKYIEMPDELKSQYQYHTQADLFKLRKNGYNKKFHSLEEGVADYINILNKHDCFS